MTKKYDFVIIGSGLGGLLCAYFLASEGKSVCVLEKNRQFGGVLQIFSRGKRVFDTGVHYVGSLDKGQNLYKIFNYVGMFPDLQLQKMDEDKFDVITMGDDPIEYGHAQGWENFEKSLIEQFPNEEKAIKEFCTRIDTIVKDYRFYNLEEVPSNIEFPESLWIDAAEYIESITDNKKLQGVLGGNNILYAGRRGVSPLYVHALIFHSYIQSAYKIKGGGGAIERILTKRLKSLGVEMKNYAEVVELENIDGRASAAILKDGRKVCADNFISNAHPRITLEMLDKFEMRKSYRNKFKRLKNTESCFTVSISVKEGVIPYPNRNYYHFENEDVWQGPEYEKGKWPNSYALYYNESRKHPGYVNSVIALCYLRFEEVEGWTETFRTIPNNDIDRGEEYRNFKKEKANVFLDFVSKRHPWIKEDGMIEDIDTSTPLTYRDYIGTPEGGLYGVVKDYQDPLSSFLAPKTKVPNVFLTGQNLNLHGILGVALSSLITIGCFLDLPELIEKINKAEEN